MDWRIVAATSTVQNGFLALHRQVAYPPFMLEGRAFDYHTLAINRVDSQP